MIRTLQWGSVDFENRCLKWGKDKTAAVITPEQRKQFALYAVAKPPLTPVLFAMLDGKDYAPIIWKMVRPRGDEKTFKVDIDL